MKLVRSASILSLSAVCFTALILTDTSVFVIEAQQWEILYPILIAVGVIAALCFLAGELTQNYSQVDKLWSILPIIYTWYFALQSLRTGWEGRPLLMAILTSLWGLRLTYNFIRRGGYSPIPWQGEEDYRWSVIRNHPAFRGHRFRLSLFNLIFICIYQNFLIFLFSTPPLFASGSPLNIYDAILTIIYLGILFTETVADQQQYDFQNQKQAQKKTGGKVDPIYRDGFVRQGLWHYSRHPNYACEQGIWICLFLLSWIPTGNGLNPSGIGVILLLLLFHSSSNFSEGISASKYPAYQKYIEDTPRFLPSPIKIFKNIFKR